MSFAASFSEFVVDPRIPTGTVAGITAKILYVRTLKFLRAEKKEKEKGKRREKERGKKMVGGEGQSSATLSLINRATMIDYLE